MSIYIKRLISSLTFESLNPRAFNEINSLFTNLFKKGGGLL